MRVGLSSRGLGGAVFSVLTTCASRANAESLGTVPPNLVRVSTAINAIVSQPQVCAGPANSALFFAASNTSGAGGLTAFFSSSDLGATWTSATLPNLTITPGTQAWGAVTFGSGDTAAGMKQGDTYMPFGYASIAVDGASNVHLFTLAILSQDANNPAGVNSRSALLHYTSPNGSTYAISDSPVAHNSTESSASAGFEDSPSILFNASSDSLYVIWAHFTPSNTYSYIYFDRLARVSAGNRTWDAPKRLDVSGMTQLPRLALGAMDQVYAVWNDLDASGNTVIAGAHSIDDGVTFSSPAILITPVVPFGYLARDGYQRINPQGMPADNTTGIRINFYASVATDLSPRATRGHVYIVWNAANPGNTQPGSDGDIFFAQLDPSTLGVVAGPKRVNDDNTLCDQFLPSIVVSRVDGSIHVLFYDRRNDPSNLLVATTLAHSSNCGQTFAQSVIPNTSFDPRPALSAGFDPALGDYLGLIATPMTGGTRLTPMWAQSLAGSPSYDLDTVTTADGFFALVPDTGACTLQDAGSAGDVADAVAAADAAGPTIDATATEGGSAHDSAADASLAQQGSSLVGDVTDDGATSDTSPALADSDGATSGAGGGPGTTPTVDDRFPEGGPNTIQGIEGIDGGGGAGTKTGCFVATAAYGDYNHPYVVILRDLRDRVLMRSGFGRAFVDWYYDHSPAAAAWLRSHDTARRLVRLALFPVVGAAAAVTYTGVAEKISFLLGTALLTAWWRRNRP